MGVPRKVRQIAAATGELFALADDGTAWRFDLTEGQWFEFPALPDAPGCTAKHRGDREGCNQQRGHRDQHWNGVRRWG